LWFDDDEGDISIFIADIPLGDIAISLFFSRERWKISMSLKKISCKKSGIVFCLTIIFSRVSQGDDEVHGVGEKMNCLWLVGLIGLVLCYDKNPDWSSNSFA